jgi:hypothetical protein
MNVLNNGTLGPTVDHRPERGWKGRASQFYWAFRQKRCPLPALNEAVWGELRRLAIVFCLGTLNGRRNVPQGTPQLQQEKAPFRN